MFNSYSSFGNNSIDNLISFREIFTLLFFLRLMNNDSRNSKTLKARILIKITTRRNFNVFFIGYFFIMFLAFIGLA
jgi:hypothetical protein